MPTPESAALAAETDPRKAGACPVFKALKSPTSGYVVYGDGSLLVMEYGDCHYWRYAETYAVELLHKHDQAFHGIEKDLLNYLGGPFAEEVRRRAGGN